MSSYKKGVARSAETRAKISIRSLARWAPRNLEVARETAASFQRLTAELGMPPTMRELASALGRAHSVMQKRVDRAIAAGLLVRADGHKSRGVRAVDGPCPLCGHAKADS